MKSSRYSCLILIKLEFSRQIFQKKILKYEISWKSFQLEQSCSMRTDRRTDMTKRIVAFRNFANAKTFQKNEEACLKNSRIVNQPNTDARFCKSSSSSVTS